MNLHQFNILQAELDVKEAKRNEERARRKMEAEKSLLEQEEAAVGRIATRKQAEVMLVNVKCKF